MSIITLTMQSAECFIIEFKSISRNINSFTWLSKQYSARIKCETEGVMHKIIIDSKNKGYSYRQENWRSRTLLNDYKAMLYGKVKIYSVDGLCVRYHITQINRYRAYIRRKRLHCMSWGNIQECSVNLYQKVKSVWVEKPFSLSTTNNS